MATVLWVAGHNGDDWNEKADKAAKATHRTEEQAERVDEQAQSTVRYTAQMDGVTLERDARTVLKQQTTRRWHQKW